MSDKREVGELVSCQVFNLDLQTVETVLANEGRIAEIF